MKSDPYEHAHANGDSAHVELWYPRSSDVRFIRVGLVDIRAADEIRISYDFVRDGWKIEQAAVFEWDEDDKACDMEWSEVAFVRAWGRARSTGNDKADG